MPLDPDIKGMLDLLASMNPPPMSSGTAESARDSFRLLTVTLRQPESIVPVRSTEDIKMDGPAGVMAARVYRPDVDGDVPTVAFFHGGGFVIGDIETHDNQCRWICREVGAVVVSFDYRLAPEAPWPAAADDCIAATKWAAENIATLGGDGSKLVVAGDSAGGNLAAVVAQACAVEGPALAAQLLIYPAVDFTPDLGETYPSRAENAEGFFLTADDMLWFSGNYVQDGDVSDPKLSPTLGTLAGLPPAVVVTAEFDPLRDEGNSYAAKLEAAGVQVSHKQFSGMIHGFFDLSPISAGAAAAVGETCAMLAKVLV